MRDAKRKDLKIFRALVGMALTEGLTGPGCQGLPLDLMRDAKHKDFKSISALLGTLSRKGLSGQGFQVYVT